jgi:hypothetical protein
MDQIDPIIPSFRDLIPTVRWIVLIDVDDLVLLLKIRLRKHEKCIQNGSIPNISFDLIILVYWYTKTHITTDIGASDLYLQF